MGSENLKRVQPPDMARPQKGTTTMSNFDPENKPEGELTDEQTSEVSGGLNPQPLPPLEHPRY
jgi:hypothetical protein